MSEKTINLIPTDVVSKDNVCSNAFTSMITFIDFVRVRFIELVSPEAGCCVTIDVAFSFAVDSRCLFVLTIFTRSNMSL